MESRGDRARRPTLLVVLALLALFFLGFGAHLVYESVYGLGHRYDTLKRRGVRVDAQLIKCAPGIGGGRGVGCRVHLTFGTLDRTWDYPEDSAQFDGLRSGDPVAMLVDPKHPTMAYTVTDVAHRTNTGFGVVAMFGVALLLSGLTLAKVSGRMIWRRRLS